VNVGTDNSITGSNTLYTAGVVVSVVVIEAERHGLIIVRVNGIDMSNTPPKEPTSTAE
jgi:hypothetical protein